MHMHMHMPNPCVTLHSLRHPGAAPLFGQPFRR